MFLLNHRPPHEPLADPLGCAIAGMALAIGTIAIDRATDGRPIPRAIAGDPNAGLQVFLTVPSSMVSLTALVLSITAVGVQLAMGQFSPRSVRPFLQDRPSRSTSCTERRVAEDGRGRPRRASGDALPVDEDAIVEVVRQADVSLEIRVGSEGSSPRARRCSRGR